jgi:hypothetical protein
MPADASRPRAPSDSSHERWSWLAPPTMTMLFSPEAGGRRAGGQKGGQSTQRRLLGMQAAHGMAARLVPPTAPTARPRAAHPTAEAG